MNSWERKKFMKKTILSVTLAASVLGLAACSGGDDKTNLVTSKDYGNITTAEFNEASHELTGPYVLKQLMLEKVLGEKYKVEDKEIDEQMNAVKERYEGNFEEELAKNGLTVEGFKKTLRLQLMQEKLLQDKAVDEAEVKKTYEQGKYELKGRHILVEDQETADKVMKELKDGKKFEDVAKEYSTDPGSKDKGGDLDWFQQGTMVPEFNDAAYELELNKVSEPVQSSFGFHIIEITDKREVKDYPKFEDKEKEIREGILAGLTQSGEAGALLEELQGELLKEAGFKTDDKLLKESLNIYNTVGEEDKADDKKSDDKEEPKADEKDKEEK